MSMGECCCSERHTRLSIIDDTPRREFSPRQRHTLKEFAVGDISVRSEARCLYMLQQITMRELELWRDKVSPNSDLKSEII